jgi:hypothetical protein
MRSFLCVVVMGLALGLSVLGSCGGREQSSGALMAKRAQPALRVVALTDVSGYLEPCGCQSKLLGGIDRAAAKLQALRADHTPVLFVAAGDLLFGDKPEGATAETDATTQETWKAETLVEIFNKLGLVAATPGKRDLSFGDAELGRLQALSQFSWLPAKPGRADAREGVAGMLAQVGEHKVGVLGVSTFAGPDGDLGSDRLQQLQAAAQAEIERLRAAGARVVVGLISSDQRSGRRMTAGLRGLDFAIQAGLDDGSTPAPSRSGQSTLLRAGRQGQGLLVLDVYLDGSAPFADWSAWTRAEHTAALNARITDLSQRIQAWERDPQVDRASVAEQRDKLKALREELAGAVKGAAIGGNAFEASYAPLTSKEARDPQVKGLLAAYDARVNEHNREAFAKVMPKAAQPGAAAYVGSARCQTCHAPAYAWWTQHAHGRAYTTLEQVHKQFNLSCVSCHVTGYGKPGGSTVVNNQGLTHVGCESCHGPGSLHVDKPAAENTKLTSAPGEAVCKQCHTPEHSDLFEFQTYVARIRAKGHGRAMAASD